MFCMFFFFFKQKTAYEMRISDWSSDVCFRSLLFRLNTVEIDLPPLRDRREDVPELLEHFLILYAKRYGQPVPAITPEAMTALRHHDWPRSEEHTSELQSLMRISYAVFCLKKNTRKNINYSLEAPQQKT